MSSAYGRDHKHKSSKRETACAPWLCYSNGHWPLQCRCDLVAFCDVYLFALQGLYKGRAHHSRYGVRLHRLRCAGNGQPGSSAVRRMSAVAAPKMRNDRLPLYVPEGGSRGVRGLGVW